MIKHSGSLCIISAPSGTGKSSLIQAILQKDHHFPFNIQVSISHTTRQKRYGEIHGKDYYFITIKKFQDMIYKNRFFEYAKIFNHYYGTEKNEIKAMLKSDSHIILNIDWQGVQQIKNKISNFYTIFILPPSKQELERRLRIRGSDTNQTIITRMQQAIKEISYFKKYDYIIINNDFNTACIHLKSIILSERLRLMYQQKTHHELINRLLYSNY